MREYNENLKSPFILSGSTIIFYFLIIANTLMLFVENNILMVIGLFAFAAIFLLMNLRFISLKGDWVFICLLLMLFVLIVPLFYERLDFFWGNYFSFIAACLVYFLTFNLHDNRIGDRLIRYLKLYGLILSMQIVYKFIDLVFLHPVPYFLYKMRFTLPLGSSNTLGFYLLLLYFLIANNINPKKRLRDFGLLGLIGISILLIMSRSTLLAFVLVLAVKNLKIKDWGKVFFAICILIILVLCLNAIMPQVTERLTRGLDFSSKYINLNAISNSRFDLYATAWKNFVQHPLFGMGLGNIKDFNNIMNSGGTTRSHNIFLDLMASSGLFGLTIYSMIIVCLVRRLYLWYQKNSIAKGTFYGYLAILIQGQLEPTIFSYRNDIFLWMIIGIAMVVIMNQKEKDQLLNESQYCR